MHPSRTMGEPNGDAWCARAILSCCAPRRQSARARVIAYGTLTTGDRRLRRNISCDVLRYSQVPDYVLFSEKLTEIDYFFPLSSPQHFCTPNGINVCVLLTEAFELKRGHYCRGKQQGFLHRLIRGYIYYSYPSQLNKRNLGVP